MKGAFEVVYFLGMLGEMFSLIFGTMAIAFAGIGMQNGVVPKFTPGSPMSGQSSLSSSASQASPCASPS